VKRLLILRHAKSSWADDLLGDADRPLAPRGERDAPKMGRRIKKHFGALDSILSSSAKRASDTARLVALELGIPPDTIRHEPALYLAAPSGILDVLRGQPPPVETLMIVGHNPGLTELVNALLPSLMLDNLPTAGIVGVDLGIESWDELPGATPRLVYFDYPKNPDPPQTCQRP